MVAFLLGASFGYGQTSLLPEEAEQLKVAFLRKAEEISGRTNHDLNRKYVEGIRNLRDRKQAEGDLESVLALNEELRTVEETGTVGTKGTTEKTGLPRLRRIYTESHQQWKEQRQTDFEVLRAEFVAGLRKVMSDLTIAGELEKAILVRNEATEVSRKRLEDFMKTETEQASTPSKLPFITKPGERRAGQIRGFGRLAATRERKEWVDFDLTPLQQYDDFVDVTGSPYLLFFLRSNGDVLNEKGEKVGQDAVKLIAEGSLGGYLDKEGKYQSIAEGDVPEETGPILAVKKFFNRKIALNQQGEVHAWGGEYDTGKRAVPQNARTGIKQLGIYYESEYALGEDGRLHRWNSDGAAEVPEPLREGISHISMFSYSGVVLSRTGELFHPDGRRPPYWEKRARHATSRGEFTIIQDVEGRWHVFAFEKIPMGNELEVLNTVMNRSTTIDVECSLYFSARNNANTASYAVWIEEVGTPEWDAESAQQLPNPAPVREGSGRNFFGIEIE